MANIVCFGEVLWDVFPNGEKKVGGAPLNVALRLKTFQHDVKMISAVGADALGEALLSAIEDQGANTVQIQIAEAYPTGTVQVKLDANKSASYTITFPSAWDFISVTEATVLAVKTADAFVFGSLAARHGASKTTLLKLLEVASFKVLDLNLRPPHYTLDVLKTLMKAADFIKFNDDELFEVCTALGLQATNLKQAVDFISTKTVARQRYF